MRNTPRASWRPGIGAGLMAAVLFASGCNDGFVSKHVFRERQNGYLAFATSEELRPDSVLNVLNHLEREPSWSDSRPAVVHPRAAFA
jgi:hypothetical protein